MYLPPNKDYTLILQVGDPDQIRLLHGDLTQYPADAIVNAANAELFPGGGVCGAIHRAGGPSIAEECRRIHSDHGSLRPGEAVATTAGKLPAKHVIHAVGPVWHGGQQGEAQVLAAAYRSSMEVADSLKLASIAFPAISTGIFGYPMEEAATVALTTLIARLQSAKSLVLVSIVLFDQPALDIFAKTAQTLRQPESGQPYAISFAHS